MPTAIPLASGSIPTPMTPQRASCAWRCQTLCAPSRARPSCCVTLHDEKLWKLNAIQVKGRLENRDGAWVFVSTTFKAPSRLAALSFFIRGTPEDTPGRLVTLDKPRSQASKKVRIGHRPK